MGKKPKPLATQDPAGGGGAAAATGDDPHPVSSWGQIRENSQVVAVQSGLQTYNTRKTERDMYVINYMYISPTAQRI